MPDPKNPIQPILRDGDYQPRFKANEIVRYLLAWTTERGLDLNKLAGMDFSNDDRCQFAQLIGYSLSGYSELSYVSDTDYNAAAAVSLGAHPSEVRAETLEQEIAFLRRDLRKPMARLFGIHPDDLKG